MDQLLHVTVRLTMSFHQDFALIGLDPDDVALRFIQRLANKAREDFNTAVANLLEKYPGRDQKGLKTDPEVYKATTGFSNAKIDSLKAKLAIFNQVFLDEQALAMAALSRQQQSY